MRMHVGGSYIVRQSFFRFGKEIEMGGEFLAKFSSVKEHKNSFSCSEMNK